MHPSSFRLVPAMFVVTALVACGGAAGKADEARDSTPTRLTATVREWEVPWPDTRPRDPYPAPDGGVWFVGQAGDYAARLDPETGEFRRIDLGDGAGPHNLIVDEAGIVWYTGNRAGYIGRLDPVAGQIEKIPMPDPEAGDPHTLVFDGRGRMWLTVQMGNFVGRFDPASRRVQLELVPTPNARPYGIVADAEGRAWFTEFAGGKLGSIDPGDLHIEEVRLRDDARPRRLVMGADGSVWYGDFAGGVLGRFDPQSGDVAEWPLPAGESARPYAMGRDDAGRIWIAETGPSPNHLVAFDPVSREFVADVVVPSGGGSIRHMAWDEARGAFWFGTDAGTIGRLDPEGRR